MNKEMALIIFRWRQDARQWNDCIRNGVSLDKETQARWLGYAEMRIRCADELELELSKHDDK